MKKITFLSIFLSIFSIISGINLLYAQVPYHGIPQFVPQTMEELPGYDWVKMSYGNSQNPAQNQGYSSDPVYKTHQIISHRANDINACLEAVPGIYLETFPIEADWNEDTDGPLATLKLGDDRVSSAHQSSQITYFFTPTNDQNILMVYFAFVAQGPMHHYEENPIFHIEILQGNNQPIEPQPYSHFLVNPQGSSPSPNPNAHSVNFLQCGNTPYDYRLWSNWIPVAFDLRDYIGQEIRLRMTVKDCLFQAHYAYAYFTAKGASGAIVSDTSNGLITLQVPWGFASYKWYRNNDRMGEIAHKITLSAEEENEEYRCVATSRTGAEVEFRNDNRDIGTLTNSLEPEKKISIYPNPATDRIVIENVASETALSLFITDITGKMIRSLTIDNGKKQNIDIRFLTPGLYFLQLKEGTHIKGTYKLIKQ